MYKSKLKTLTKEEELKWIGCVGNAVPTPSGRCRPVQFELVQGNSRVVMTVHALLQQPVFRKSRKKRMNEIALEHRFRALVDEWRRDTVFLSSVTKLVKHPAYQHIIEMGEAALPLLFKELQVRPDHWFWALSAITSENPVKQEDAGDIDKMTLAWMEGGKKENYI